MKYIKDTALDKISGKLIEYRQGDCLSVLINDNYLAAFVSRKFNNYYDLTLLEYRNNKKPNLFDFKQGRFFGTRFGSWEHLTYALNVRMISCKYIDSNINVVKVGSVNLIPTVTKDGYAYLDNLIDLENHYMEELPIRIEKSKNAAIYPELAFASKHLVDMRHIIK